MFQTCQSSWFSPVFVEGGAGFTFGVIQAVKNPSHHANGKRDRMISPLLLSLSGHAGSGEVGVGNRGVIAIA
jgi:hypothetical protein